MIRSESQNKKVKEDIKMAFAEGNLLALIRAGLYSLLDILSNPAPLAFQRFLEYTGSSFDKYILDTSKQENLKYVGGKMILSLGEDAATEPVPISLSADFYFQTPDKKWVVKKKSGNVDSSRFTDWDSDADAVTLRKTGKLELSIEPPSAGTK